jgi:cell division transport system permease protein
MSANKSKPKYLFPILSIALVLFVLGIFLLITLQAKEFVQKLKESVDVWIEMHDGASPDEAAQLIEKINTHPNIVPESVTWISKEQAAAMIKKELGDESLLEDLPNMMRDVVRFHIRADRLNIDDMAHFREEMKSDTLVSELFFETANAENITSNMEKLSLIALILGIILIFVSSILIHNTVRLSLFSNRLLVKNMQLVGATHAYIRKPYAVRATMNGLWAALIAICLLLACMYALKHFMQGMIEIDANWSNLVTFALLVLIGVLISLLSTWYTLNKYLNARIEDLY